MLQAATPIQAHPKPRRKPSPITAPRGQCSYCDARRDYNRQAVAKCRPPKVRK